MTDPNHIAEARKKVGRPQIREAFLRNGARIEPGRDDLPDWVYESVFELLDSVIQQAAPAIQYVAPAIQQAGPDVQGEPVGEVRLDLGAPSVIYAELYSETLPSLAPGTKLYTAPQPEEQQPDVTQLVEALERLVGDVERATHVEFGGTPWLKEKMAEIDYARAALAAHRKGGGA